MLTTLATLKQQLGVDVDLYDQMLIRLIRAATDAIESECRREFTRREYVEMFYPMERRLILAGYPVDEVIEVLVDGDAYTDHDVDEARGFLYPARGDTWGREVRVTYTAGYILPPSDERDLPYDLENACIVLAATSYNTDAVAGIRSEQVEQLRIQYEPQAIPVSAQRVIQRHKDWRR